MEYTKKEILKKLALIIVGGLISCFGFVTFLEPAGINCGGVSGIAMLVNHVADHPFITMGTVVAMINIPLFLISYRKIGKFFFFTSLLGMAVTAVGFDYLALLLPKITVEPLLAAVFGSVIIGAGFGMVFLAGASTGGVDIMARLMKLKFRNCPIGKMILCFDLCIAVATGFVFGSVNNTLYSTIVLYLSSVVLDYVIYSVDYAKVAFVITDKYEAVAETIAKDMDRGVTLLQGQGYFKRQDKFILLCAVKRKQLAELKERVNTVDPDAFVILQDAQQVLGDGFKRYDRFEL